MAIENLDVFPHTVGGLDDKPNLSAEQMKAAFEADCNALWDKVMEMIPELNAALPADEVSTTVDSSSTDSEIPTSKAVYNAIADALLGSAGTIAEGIIDDWLDDHPEATTTVQDGAVTEAKLHSDLKKKVVNNYLTPQMYGAVCDGTTDDSTALQSCITAASTNDLPVYVTKSLLINSDITVPSNVRISGIRNNEATPYILIGAGCSTAFTFNGVRNIVEDIGFKSATGAYASINCLDFQGNSSNNIDSVVDNVVIAFLNKAITVHGRNVEIKNSTLSHCRVGVHFTSTADGMRGWQVESCRFHGIGQEEALSWFQNSYGILVDGNVYENSAWTSCNVTIRDNISDQGGCFVYGKMSNALIENNFIESYAVTPIQIIAGGVSQIAPTSNGSIVINGNFIKGKEGQVRAASGDDPAVSVGLPQYGIQIDRILRCVVSNNTFSRTKEQSVRVTNVSWFAGTGNTFQSNGNDDLSKAAAYLVNHSTNVILHDNHAYTGNMALLQVTGTVTASIHDNDGFETVPTTGYTALFNDKWMSVGSCASINGSISGSVLPSVFMVTATVSGEPVQFLCAKNGDVISGGTCWVSNTTYYGLFFEKSGTSFVPKLYRHTSADDSPVGMSVWLTFFARVND
jgi:hypothetical protein